MVDREQWEYEVVNLMDSPGNKESRKEILNTLGLEGWELVCIDFGYNRAYLKRKIG